MSRTWLERVEHMTEEHGRVIKTVIAGTEGVGKSNLLDRLAGREPRGTNKTLGAEFFKARFKVSESAPSLAGATVDFQLWDLCGQERFASIASIYFRNAQCALLCFDVTSLESLDGLVSLWMPRLKGSCDDVSAVLVGLKSDLAAQRVVSRDAAESTASELGVPYVETSSVTGDGIADVLPSVLWGIPQEAPRSGVAAVVQKRLAFVGSEGVPLRRIAFSAQIVGSLCTVRETHTFCNTSKGDPIEVAFTVPSDRSKVICGFELCVGGVVTRGDIRAVADARAKYDDALASGRRAALVEEDDDGSLSLSIGVLQPQQEASVNFTLCWELPLSADGSSVFRLPLVQQSGADGQRRTGDGDGGCFAEGNIEISSSRGIGTVECFSHGNHVDRPNTESALVTVHRTPLPCPDVEVLFRTDGCDGASASAAVVRGNELALSISFFPSVGDIQSSSTYVIIADRSGSMSGAKWKQAQRATVLFLKSLPKGCLFNVYGFGSKWVSTFPDAVQNSDRTVEEAVAAVSKWSADLGGTEMSGPIGDVVSKAKGRRTVALLLTDGSDAHGDAVLNALSSKAVSVFPMGIGNDVNSDFLERVARSTAGKKRLVGPNDRLEGVVISQLQDAMEVAVPATVDWSAVKEICSSSEAGSTEFVSWPSANQSVSLNSRNTLFALCKLREAPSPTAAAVGVTISCVYEGRDLRWTVPIDIGHALQCESTSLIHQLAGRRVARESPAVSTALAVKYQFLCPGVAFVAVGGHGNDSLGATPVLTKVVARAQVPAGLFVSGGIAALVERNYSMPSADVIRLDAVAYGAPLYKSASCCGGGGGGRSYSPPQSRSEPAVRSSPPVRKAVPAAGTSTADAASSAAASNERGRASLDIILRCQHADGHFAINDEARKAFAGIAAAEAKKPQPDMPAEVWATCLVVVLLETQLAMLSDEWNLVAAKAREYIVAHFSGASLAKCVADARAALKQ